MAQMTAIVDKLLTQASSMYVPENYISESILPLVTVQQKTGKLAKYGTNHLRIESSLVGGRGEYRRVESVVRSTGSYSVDSYGLEDVVTPDDYSNVEVPYDAELDVVMGLSTLLWLKKEKSLADTLEAFSYVANRIKSGQGTIGRLLTDESIYNNLDELTADLKVNPWKLLYRPKQK